MRDSLSTINYVTPCIPWGRDMGKALTVKTLETIKPGPIRREIPDGYVRGLYFVVQPSGVMSWACRYRLGTERGNTRSAAIRPLGSSAPASWPVMHWRRWLAASTPTTSRRPPDSRRTATSSSASSPPSSSATQSRTPGRRRRPKPSAASRRKSWGGGRVDACRRSRRPTYTRCWTRSLTAGRPSRQTGCSPRSVSAADGPSSAA